MDELLGRKVVSEEDFKQDSRFEPGTVLYLVAWEGHGDDENSWEPRKHISSDLISDYERQILESEAADAEGEPEDDDDDDEFMEVDVDASEVEQVVHVQIVRHTLQWRNKKYNGGLGNVWVMVKYSDGSTTPGYVSSEFLGDTKEGLDVLRACTECTKVHAVGSIKQLNVSTASESGSNSVQCGKKYRMTVQKYTIICSDDQYCHSRRERARRSRERPHSDFLFF